MQPEIALTSGLLLGLAGSAHCACLCGGIASSLLLATSPATDRMTSLVVIQLGRVLTYSAAGAVVGAAGSTFGTLLAFSGGQEVLRLLAALALVWAGLSVVGVLPAIRRLDGGVMAVVGRLPAAIARPVRASTPLLAGIGWGLAPCAMVYNGLMTAMLSGSAAGGAIFMSGFGLATIPAVAAVATGSAMLAGSGSTPRRGPQIRRVAGFGLAAIGVVSAAFPAATLASLCIS